MHKTKQTQETRRGRSSAVFPATAASALPPPPPPQQQQQRQPTVAEAPNAARTLLLLSAADGGSGSSCANGPSLPPPPHVAPLSHHRPLAPSFVSSSSALPAAASSSASALAARSARSARCRALALRAEKIVDLLWQRGDAVFPIAAELSAEAARLTSLAREAAAAASSSSSSQQQAPSQHPEFRLAAALRPLWSALCALLRRVRACGVPAAVRVADVAEERVKELRGEVERWAAQERDACGPRSSSSDGEGGSSGCCAACGGEGATAYCPGPCGRCYHPWCVKGTPFVSDRMCKDCLRGAPVVQLDAASGEQFFFWYASTEADADAQQQHPRWYAEQPAEIKAACRKLDEDYRTSEMYFDAVWSTWRPKAPSILHARRERYDCVVSAVALQDDVEQQQPPPAKRQRSTATVTAAEGDMFNSQQPVVAIPH